MESRPALQDLKICDLMWVIAGPAATRMLADYGATVVRIESPTRMDTARTAGPYHGNKPEAESSAVWNNYNAGKLGITLDLSIPKARDVVLDLVRWADVVTDSFVPGAMQSWRLDYESLREVKPDLIMLSTCLMGQTGPLASFAGYGNLAAAITGFYSLCGWPDRPPAGPFGAYTDYISPRFIAVAILAALEYKRRTGRGQYIDLSQAESALHFLAPALLDWSANERVWGQVGNHDAEHAPHGVYPTADDDRWVAIACRDDHQWHRLCALMARPDLVGDNRFRSSDDRQRNRAELDALISDWTRQRNRHEIEEVLQAQGIPASAVQDSEDCIRDRQLLHRGHFVELSHTTLRKTTVESSRLHLSRTQARVDRAAPTLGEHSHYVLETVLGYDEERISELAMAGALG